VTALAAKLATSLAPHVEFEKDLRRSDPGKHSVSGFLLNRGGYVVNVAGRRWAMISLEHHGCHGATYHLNQFVGESCRECRGKYPDSDRTYSIRIWGDKHYLQHELKPGQQPKPLIDRLRTMVVHAIRDGWLRDPAILAAEARTNADKARANEVRRLQEAEDKWRAKAAEVIGPVKFSITAELYADLTARIVDAMKWAQTH